MAPADAGTIGAMKRTLLVLLALAALTPPILAAEGEAVLRFRDGRFIPGTVVELREDGVLHRSERGTILWSWSDLTPFSRYEARAAVLEEDDGPGRLALGRWCLENSLPAEARSEIRRAAGLGAGTEEQVAGLLALCDEDEATLAFEEADRHVAAEDLDAALATLKAYLVRAPASSWTDGARERAADLVRRIELEAERERLDAEKAKKERDAAGRNRYIADTMEKGDESRTRGSRAALVALREEAGGSTTKFRGAVSEAETRYLEARKLYERARRSAGEDLPVEARAALSSRRSVEGRLLDLYLRLARLLVRQKNWQDAQTALDKALRLDPVNPEGLDMQDKIDANRIRRKASDLTNAQGRTTDGTGGNR